MPRLANRPADLETLNGGLRLLDELGRMPCIELNCASEAFSGLSSAEDIPLVLRGYYANIGKNLAESEHSLKSSLRLMKAAGSKLHKRIDATLDSLELSAENLKQMHFINQRLRVLEASLHQQCSALHERLTGIHSAEVEWDDWDGTEIRLRVRFRPDSERPSYNPDQQSDINRDALDVCVNISQGWIQDENMRGLNDGQNHSDLGECEGSPLQYFSQCFLFHELYDHAEIGLWGMLNLHSLWIEIIPHRSGDFRI